MQKKRGVSAVKNNGTFSGGWLKCAPCGCNIIYDPKTKANKATDEKKIHNYYHCTNGRRQHPTLKGMNITEEKIFEQFGPMVNGITISKTFAGQIADALNELNRKAKAKTIEQAEGYKKALAELEVREDKIYDDFKQGVLDDDGYRRQFKRVRDERSHFTKLLTDSNLAVQDAFMEKAETILELAINAELHWKSMVGPDRREFLNKLVSNPVLDGPTVRYELKKPFVTIVKMNEKSNWRALIPRLRTEILNQRLTVINGGVYSRTSLIAAF